MAISGDTAPKRVDRLAIPPPGTGAIGLPAAVAVAGGAGLFVAVVLLAGVRRGDTVQFYLRDPAALLDYSPFLGLVSNLGVLVMVATAAICLFASRLDGEDRALLAPVGLLTAYIAADDFFLIHEVIARDLFGLSEVVVIGGIGLATLAIARRFRHSVLGPSHGALHLAVGLLALSVVFDFYVPGSWEEGVLEDGLKFAGYATWSAYWISRAHAGLPSGRAGSGGPGRRDRVGEARPRHGAGDAR